VVTGAAVAANFFGATDVESLRGAPQAVAAAFCFATFFFCTSRIGNDGRPAQRLLVCCAVACLLMLVLSAATGWALLPAGPESVAAALTWIVALGVLGQVIPVFLLVHFGPRTGSALGSILTSTELPVAVGISALVLGDKIGPAQLAGVGLVLVGIALPHVRRGGAVTVAAEAEAGAGM
jgi:drug/metabolite transporter (DMT)-like permease